MSKASLYECCVAVNKAQKKQKVKRLFTSTVPIHINQIWPPFMINVGRMPKSRAAAIMNACYGLSSSFEEYKKKIEEEFKID